MAAAMNITHRICPMVALGARRADRCRLEILPRYRRILAVRLCAMTNWRAGLSVAFLAAEFAFMSGYFGAAAQEQPAAVASAAPSIPCGGNEIARGSVGRVLDGRNFVLDDGRRVHLAAIEVPLLPAPDGAAAKSALEALLTGAQVVLRQAEFAPDRYGRIVAYVEALGGNSQRSAQAEMLSAGFARVGGDVGRPACAAELLHREDTARKARLGLWASPYYDPIRADEPANILEQRDRFALVEGKVVSVHASGATLYVNFGRHWSEDFAVTVRKRNERNFAASGLDLGRLAGRRVRVRGWIEAHGGASGTGGRAGGGLWRAPWIEAAHPVQIEIADHD